MRRRNDKIILSNWGKEIKKSIIDRDLSVKELADEYHVSQTYINNIIRGDAYDQLFVTRISEKLGVIAPAGPAFTKCRRIKAEDF